MTATGDDPVPIGGTCDPAMSAVRDAFARGFVADEEDAGDLGAAVAVIADGKVVVDLHGGWRDVAGTQPWRADTLVNAYSVGKALTALAVLVLVERGDLALDRPIATWWPTFAHEGKGAVTLREVLSHRAGLPAVRVPLPDDAVYDWDAMTGALAATRPFWEPGTAHGYHVNTLGFLAGEPACRAVGGRFGEVLRELVALPTGADVHVGLPVAHHPRAAEIDLPWAVDRDAILRGLGADVADDGDDRDPDELDVVRMRRLAYANPPSLSGLHVVGTSRWRSAEVPSTNPHVTALGVARTMAASIGAGPPGTPALLPRALVREATTVHSAGHDLVLDRPSTFGLGFMLDQPERPIGIGPASFGHYGFGGSLAFADPEARIGFGYVLNRPGDRWRVPRTRRLLAALASCL